MTIWILVISFIYEIFVLDVKVRRLKEPIAKMGEVNKLQRCGINDKCIYNLRMQSYDAGQVSIAVKHFRDLCMHRIGCQLKRRN